ncbi:hypothetical protein A8C56_18530 [Niabella ginsenosidivorans]|uniref:Uncharacterized protein n=1 Tax=Niabella ginsenosidivorans TaxID=1176587 RepID=A0A1A9I4V5_9BACT|nr:hypothetical protein A8C56_18530 [Niabella ginsenosidivorans]
MQTGKPDPAWLNSAKLADAYILFVLSPEAEVCFMLQNIYCYDIKKVLTLFIQNDGLAGCQVSGNCLALNPFFSKLKFKSTDYG